ncbi:hypothetical protein DFJ58DRAFT_733407 [Suillus subalutaceus]|uniref:uncharacterized protein n=1 Tax=Suillus subalutaceus TaxID=48586 RepID=UPI001B867678|nr:uncharacterized protein DFJ58DRAFT_733407 [Suillus subalutaceus]KAG1839332.1 hypothetical protein DFJ58DRAFT_733407 [Suillus subalutaceus]
MGSEKKPLNPVLGELFYVFWPANVVARGGKTTLVVEYVSHHPPITAYRIENLEKGDFAQKTSFSGRFCFLSSFRGKHCRETSRACSFGCISSSEEYLITPPRLRIDGLWYGSPYIELAETGYIQSSTGWLSTIEYKGKGYFSGKSHTFKATLTPPSHIHTSPHVIEGTSNELHSGATFHNVTSPKEEITVAAVEEARGVGEHEVVGKIENEQRREDASSSLST